MNPFLLSYPTAFLVPILSTTPFVSYRNHQTPRNSYTHACIHIHPLQPGHISPRDTKIIPQVFLKCRPTGQIHGSDFRVKIYGLAEQVQSTRMRPVSHESIGRWRVGSGRVRSRGFHNLAGRVGSSQHIQRHSRVRSGQLTRPYPTREV